MLRRPLLALALALAPLLGFGIAPAIAQTPVAFVQEMADEVLAVANAPDLGEAAALDRLRTLLRERFAVTTMGAFAIGSRWQTMSDQEKRDYIAAYERYLMGQYARRFGALEGAAFLATGTNTVGRDTGVTAVISLPAGDQYALRFRVRGSGGDFQILDAEVSGTSFLLTQRDEFQGLLRQTGGDIDQLIAAMDRISGA